MTGRAAVFLDRDGTLVEDLGYLSSADQLRLLPGAGDAVARLNRAGLPVVVVTNQSGIARGRYSEGQYLDTERRLETLLAEHHARVEAQYFCPHHPAFTGPCDCRKPATLLYRRAAERLGLDLTASWWVGDRLRDVQPAAELGGRGILLLTGAGLHEAPLPAAHGFVIVPDLPAAAQRILGGEAAA